MTPEISGKAMALLCALTWSMSLVLFKGSSEHVSPLLTNIFKTALAFPLFWITGLVVGEPSFLATIRGPDLLLVLASGVAGIALADTLVLECMARTTAGTLAVIECLYSPMCLILSALFLGEVLSPIDGLGIALIALGLALALWRRGRSPDDKDAGSRRGWALLGGCTGILLMGVSIVAIKPIMGQYSVLAVTEARLVGAAGGMVVLLILAKLRERRRTRIRGGLSATAASPPIAVAGGFANVIGWPRYVAAAILSTYISTLFWVGGMHGTAVSIAAVLNQTSTIFTLVLSAIFLREPLSRRMIGGTLLAFVGASVILSY